MKTREIIAVLEAVAPPSLQESYDNSGLLTGSPDQEITGVLVCLDSTEAVLDEAIATNCNMIIAHHPIVFGGLKKITGKNYVERVIIKAIKNDIALYALHTNLDNVYEGVNRKIAEKLQLVNLQILQPKDEILLKLVTFVPSDHAEKVRNALFEAGAGNISRYSECSFNMTGIGTFNPGSGTDPFSGRQGVRSKEKEERIEVILEKHRMKTVEKALKAVHPYEEVAYDFYSLMNKHKFIGAGMLGHLLKPMDTHTFLEMVKKQLNAGIIKYTKPFKTSISSVAICGGSGSFLLNDAIASGADIFITADYKYHQFFDADGRIIIADVGHYESEQFTGEIIAEILKDKFPTFAVRLTKVNTNPVNYL